MSSLGSLFSPCCPRSELMPRPSPSLHCVPDLAGCFQDWTVDSTFQAGQRPAQGFLPNTLDKDLGSCTTQEAVPHHRLEACLRSRCEIVCWSLCELQALVPIAWGFQMCGFNNPISITGSLIANAGSQAATLWGRSAVYSVL